MSQLGRVLIVSGLILAALGVVFVLGGKLGLGRLPGDFAVERKNVTIYFPIVTSIIVSLVLTLLANLFLRRR